MGIALSTHPSPVGSGIPPHAPPPTCFLDPPCVPPEFQPYSRHRLDRGSFTVPVWRMLFAVMPPVAMDPVSSRVYQMTASGPREFSGLVRVSQPAGWTRANSRCSDMHRRDGLPTWDPQVSEVTPIPSHPHKKIVSVPIPSPFTQYSVDRTWTEILCAEKVCKLSSKLAISSA